MIANGEFGIPSTKSIFLFAFCFFKKVIGTMNMVFLPRLYLKFGVKDKINFGQSEVKETN